MIHGTYKKVILCTNVIHTCPLMSFAGFRDQKKTVKKWRLTNFPTKVRQGSVIKNLNCCVIVETEKIEKTKKQKVNKWFSKRKVKRQKLIDVTDGIKGLHYLSEVTMC